MRRDSRISSEDEQTILDEINGRIRKCFLNTHSSQNERMRSQSRCSYESGEVYSNDKVQEDVYLTDRTVPKLNLLNNSLMARLRKTIPAEVLTNDEAMHRIRRDTVKDIVRMKILRKQLFSEASQRAAIITSEEQSLIQRHYQMRQRTKELNRQTHEQLLKAKMSASLPGTKTIPSHKTPHSFSSLYSFDGEKSEIDPRLAHMMYERNKEGRIEVGDDDVKEMREKVEAASLLRRPGTNASISTSRGRRRPSEGHAVTASTISQSIGTMPSIKATMTQATTNAETVSRAARATSRVTFNAPSENSDRASGADEDIVGADDGSVTETTQGKELKKPKPPPMPFERYAIRPLSNTSRHSAPTIRSTSRASAASSSNYAPSSTDTGVSVTFQRPRRSAGSRRGGERTRDLHPVATGLNHQGTSVEKTRFRALNRKGDIKVAKVWTRKHISTSDLPIVWAREDTYIDEPPISPFQR
ncbi:uncharacterized protein LOC135484993 [Lineus longissimus]|uniref:uncharacterized protein LOC135484993 n=1 Tax=Lineus longissimus TaxID=88925 RepID=UPI002B4CD5CA